MYFIKEQQADLHGIPQGSCDLEKVTLERIEGDKEGIPLPQGQLPENDGLSHAPWPDNSCEMLSPVRHESFNELPLFGVVAAIFPGQPVQLDKVADVHSAGLLSVILLFSIAEIVILSNDFTKCYASCKIVLQDAGIVRKAGGRGMRFLAPEKPCLFLYLYPEPV